MPFSFPSSPSIGGKSTQNGREYQWSGYAWEIVATPASLNASVITAGTLGAARLPLATTVAAGAVIVGTGLGVSSGTVSVTYGTTSGTACQGNDSRLSDARTPTGAAGGDLTGTYPNPQIAAGAVVTADIANDAVTYAKIQNVSATDRLLGRSSAGSGDVEEILCTSFGRSLIGSADAAAARTTLSVQPTASPAFTGTVSAAAASLTGAVTITRSTSTGAVADIPHIVFNNRNFTNATFVAGGVFSNTFRDVADPHYSAGMWFVRAPFSGNNSSSGDIVFGTGENVAQSAFPTERLRIAASGVSTFSGQLLVTTGSASACGVAFSGDPDTGIAQLSAAGANTLSICTSSAERVRVDASANVNVYGADATISVGTNSYGRFQTSGGNAVGYLYGSFAALGDGIHLTYNHYHNAAGTAFVQNSAGGTSRISCGYSSIAFSTGAVNTAPTERLKIDASGNVGIGKSPSYRLDVLGDIGIDSAGNAVLRYGRNNSYKWAIYNDTSDNFIFYSDAAFAERLRISSTGQVIVGTTGQGAYNLQCNGTGVWGAGAYVNGSDERIKDDITPIAEATSVIAAMQPVTFRYKPTWSSDQSIQPGFIAQQLQEALAGTPYLDGVVQQGTEYLSVAYQSLIPLLVKALQESNARIAALEERNHA